MVGAKKLVLFLILVGLIFPTGQMIFKVEQEPANQGDRYYREDNYFDQTVKIIRTNETHQNSHSAGVVANRDKTGKTSYSIYIDGKISDSCSIPKNNNTCYLTPDLETSDLDMVYSVLTFKSSYGHVDLYYITIKPGKELIVDGYPCDGGRAGFHTCSQADVYNIGTEDISSPFYVEMTWGGYSRTFRVSSLKSRESVAISTYDFVFPEPGPTEYRLRVDTQNNIDEFDEGNNFYSCENSVFGTHINNLSRGIDLVGGQCTAPSEVKPYEPFSIECEVLNIGDEDVNSSFTVELSILGERVHQERISSLAARSVKSFKKEGLAVSGEGYVNFKLEVDTANEIKETYTYTQNGRKYVVDNEYNNKGGIYGSIEAKNSSGDSKVTLIGSEQLPEEMLEPEEANETKEIGLCKNVSCKNYCSGKTLYSSGKCNEKTGKCEYSSRECENGCDPESARCIQLTGNVDFDVFIEDYEQGVVGSGEDSFTVTARLMEEGAISVEPIEGANVVFEVVAPAGSGAFRQYGGKMTIEGTTNSNGEANANIEIPALEEFYPGSRQDTYVTLTVKASKHSDGLDFDYEDGPYTIKVLSPAVSIEKITISPNPAKAYEMHDVKIKTSDAYAGGPAHYVVSVTQGILSFEKTRGEPGGGIAFDKSGTEAHVNWEAPERGLTPYEFDYAKEVRDANKDWGVGAGSSVVGIAFPIVKSGETIYGMYGDAKNVVGEIGQLDESLSAEEGAWRILDATVSDVKLMIGAVNLVVGVSPGVGSAAVGFGEDTFIYGLERGQAVIKENAAEARWEETETRKIDQMIRVDVVDSEGYSDTDFLIYEMEYLWEKGVAE